MPHRPANHRDVGDALTLWLPSPPVAPGRLLRGGRFDGLTTCDDLGRPATVLNLRRGPDPEHLDVTYVHCPMPNQLEVYDTARHGVRRWLVAVVDALVAAERRWPVYVHCSVGRDRTGVVVACLLDLLGVPHDVIVGEYGLSDGADEARIAGSLAGLRTRPLDVDVDRLRGALSP